VMMVSNYVFLVGSSVGRHWSSLWALCSGRRYDNCQAGFIVALIAIICGLTSSAPFEGAGAGAIYNVLTPTFVPPCGGWERSILPISLRWGRVLASARAELVRKARASEGLKASFLWVDGAGGFEGVSLSTFSLAEMGIGIYQAPASREVRPVAQF
jgi:hypothetical protein